MATLDDTYIKMVAIETYFKFLLNKTYLTDRNYSWASCLPFQLVHRFDYSVQIEIKRLQNSNNCFNIDVSNDR